VRLPPRPAAERAVVRAIVLEVAGVEGLRALRAERVALPILFSDRRRSTMRQRKILETMRTKSARLLHF
jgi:hypothetical protein